MTREQMIDEVVRKFPEHIAAFRDSFSDYLARLESLDGMELALLSAMFSTSERAALSADWRRRMGEG